MTDHKQQLPRPRVPDAHTIRQIAVHASVHPRTVVRCYRSQPVRSTVASRVVAAAALLSIPLPDIVVAR